jgi:hypothetical protein
MSAKLNIFGWFRLARRNDMIGLEPVPERSGLNNLPKRLAVRHD